MASETALSASHYLFAGELLLIAEVMRRLISYLEANNHRQMLTPGQFV
jgi:hypothetical protein